MAADVELKSNGANAAVTIWNLDKYVKCLLDASLGAGISGQILALRAGFEDVLPLRTLALFDKAELDRLLCGDDLPWTVSCPHYY